MIWECVVVVVCGGNDASLSMEGEWIWECVVGVVCGGKDLWNSFPKINNPNSAKMWIVDLKKTI